MAEIYKRQSKVQCQNCRGRPCPPANMHKKVGRPQKPALLFYFLPSLLLPLVLQISSSADAAGGCGQPPLRKTAVFALLNLFCRSPYS